MARLERFKSVFDEFQDGFDRGFDRQVKLAALVQQARAQYAQEERARANTNLDISRFNLAEPAAAAKAARDTYFLQKVAPELDYYSIQQRNAVAETASREAQLQQALSKQDFETARKLTGKQWRYYNGRIESSGDGQNWFAGNAASDIVDQGLELTRAGQSESLRQLRNAANPPAPAVSNPSSSVFTQPAAAPSPADIAFPLTGGAGKSKFNAGSATNLPSYGTAPSAAPTYDYSQSIFSPEEQGQSGFFDRFVASPTAVDNSASERQTILAQIQAYRQQIEIEPNPATKAYLRQQIQALQAQLGQ
jgi:hypothetical protein